MLKRKRISKVNFQSEIKEVLICKFCTFETNDIHELNQHVLIHEDKRNLEEGDNVNKDICLSNEMPSKRKRKVEHPPQMFNCPYCKYSTKRKYDLPKHLITHSTSESVTIYKCSQCPYETKRKNDMPKHMIAHCTDVQMFECPECPYQTKRKSDLPKHLLCHKPSHEVPLYKCSNCSYVTKRKGDLSKHILNHKDNSDLNMFGCSECEYKTKRKNDLHKHMLIHCDRHVTGVFKCLKCIFATDKINKFSKHVLSECTYCEDAINVEHLMLEDIIASVDGENVFMEDSEEEEDKDEYPEENNDDGDCGEENQCVSYEPVNEVNNMQENSENHRNGVFNINLGEFSVESEDHNSEDDGHHVYKEEYVGEED